MLPLFEVVVIAAGAGSWTDDGWTRRCQHNIDVSCCSVVCCYVCLYVCLSVTERCCVWCDWQAECRLVQCREQTMDEDVAVSMFTADKYGPAVKQGHQCTLVTCSMCCATALRHTHTHNRLMAFGTQVGWYQKKHSPTHTHPDQWTSFINYLTASWVIQNLKCQWLKHTHTHTTV